VSLVGDDGALPLPWLAAPLSAALTGSRGHALLVHGAPGVGARAFAFTLAQAWLCEDRAPERAAPCGRCGSCRLVQSRVHPDLTVLLPETLRRELDWPLPDDKPDSERKPSRQIRVDDVRLLIERSTRTSARGRGKVLLLHPAEAVNAQAANALLKTLEEPAPGTRLLLTVSDPALLLPTLRSRCQTLRLATPHAEAATAWLLGQGLPNAADAATLLAACSGRPLDALDLMQAGVDARSWAALPAAMAAGQGAALTGWPVPRAIDALLKLCHDAQARAAGAPATYFPQTAVPTTGDAARLSAWSRELQRVARHDEHPWNEPLLVDALVRGAAAALARPPRALATLRP
jgi:DNA polymerase-3 subunit delta'